ncbi:SGNH/GDSL hydrolase family protein, partial [Staphylococcus epidermidis]
LIIVQGTDDDWTNDINIGTDKTDTKTFYGAFYSAITKIKSNNPNSKIIVMTPTKQCYIKDGKTVRKDTTKNDLGHTLADYVDVQIDACNELDIPVYDAYHSTQFKPNIPSYRKSSMPDGVHPNEKGHEVIMYELIKNFYGFYG